MKLKIEYVPTDKIAPYKGNAKIHTPEQIEQIKDSILQFGFNDPIAIWGDGTVIEGHGRLIAARELHFDKVPVIRLDELTDDQRRAYILVHRAGISRGRWMGAFQNANPVNDSSTTGAGVLDNINSRMANYGEGSRGVVQIFYKGGGGHVFNVERMNGKTIYAEAQAGRIKDMSRVIDHVRPDRVALVRTDNLKLSDRAKNFVTPSR